MSLNWMSWIILAGRYRIAKCGNFCRVMSIHRASASSRSQKNAAKPGRFQWHEDCVMNDDMSIEEAHTSPPRLGIRAAIAARRSPSLHDIAGRYDIRAITPREMADL